MQCNTTTVIHFNYFHFERNERIELSSSTWQADALTPMLISHSERNVRFKLTPPEWKSGMLITNTNHAYCFQFLKFCNFLHDIKDSNLNQRFWRPVCYRYTNVVFCTPTGIRTPISRLEVSCSIQLNYQGI